MLFCSSIYNTILSLSLRVFRFQIPGMWLLEGGQSATGSLLDHIITTHPAYQELKQKVYVVLRFLR